MFDLRLNPLEHKIQAKDIPPKLYRRRPVKIKDILRMSLHLDVYTDGKARPKAVDPTAVMK